MANPLSPTNDHQALDLQGVGSPQITAAMVEAGLKALNDAEAANWMPDRASAVERVYRAMRLLSPK
jgi:hypothetical protein